jgi:hypothetical protein
VTYQLVAGRGMIMQEMGMITVVARLARLLLP